MKRTNNFIFTAMLSSFADASRIDDLRLAVKKTNRFSRDLFNHRMRSFNLGYRDEKPQMPPLYRVRLMPRGPRKAAALLDGKHPRSYDQYLPMRHAKWFDVYIHEVK